MIGVWKDSAWRQLFFFCCRAADYYSIFISKCPVKLFPITWFVKKILSCEMGFSAYEYKLSYHLVCFNNSYYPNACTWFLPHWQLQQFPFSQSGRLPENECELCYHVPSDHIQKSKERLNTILSENTGKSIDEIAAATERDNYMTAREAVNFGLIDKIIDRR